MSIPQFFFCKPCWYLKHLCSNSLQIKSDLCVHCVAVFGLLRPDCPFVVWHNRLTVVQKLHSSSLSPGGELPLPGFSVAAASVAGVSSVWFWHRNYFLKCRFLHWGKYSGFALLCFCFARMSRVLVWSWKELFMLLFITFGQCWYTDTCSLDHSFSWPPWWIKASDKWSTNCSRAL